MVRQPHAAGDTKDPSRSSVICRSNERAPPESGRAGRTERCVPEADFMPVSFFPKRSGAILARSCAGPSCRHRGPASDPGANADRLGEFRRGRRHGRRAGERAEGRLAHHRHGCQRRARPLPFPRRPAFTRTLRAAHPRRGLRSGRSASRRARHSAGRGRDQVAADRRSCGATHQYRMAHEHARHAATEAAADRMHELSHAGTDRALDLQRRGIRSRPRAHGAVRQQHHAGPRAGPRCQARGA